MTDWFAGRVAETYDGDETAHTGVDPVVDFLSLSQAAARSSSASARAASRFPSRSAAFASTGSISHRTWSPARKKPGGAAIPVAIGDFATTTVDARFSLVYLVFDTIMNLTSQDAQVACFQNAAAHLEPGGQFVIEVGVPDLQRLPRGEVFRPFTVRPDHLGVDEYDVLNQGLVSHHYRARRRPGRDDLDAVPLRLARRARSDGAARGDAPRRALGWMAAGAVHAESTSPSPRGWRNDGARRVERPPSSGRVAGRAVSFVVDVEPVTAEQLRSRCRGGSSAGGRRARDGETGRWLRVLLLLLEPLTSQRVCAGASSRRDRTAIARACSIHARALGRERVITFIDAAEPYSIAFAERFGLEDVDVQLEQRRTIGGGAALRRSRGRRPDGTRRPPGRAPSCGLGPFAQEGLCRHAAPGRGRYTLDDSASRRRGGPALRAR